jgi:hypothetical protein
MIPKPYFSRFATFQPAEDIRVCEIREELKKTLAALEAFSIYSSFVDNTLFEETYEAYNQLVFDSACYAHNLMKLLIEKEDNN